MISCSEVAWVARRVDLQSPTSSLIPTKPLDETPPNHPNPIWLTDQDPHYLTILGWIGGGAPR